MHEKFFFKTVIEKYKNKKEIEYLKKTSDSGLYDYEEIIIEKYCKEPGRALIIGCGAGREVLSMGEKHISITGIDIVEELTKIAFKKAKEKNIKAHFLTMNAKDLALKSDSFDYVILLGQLISLIPLRKNRIKMLQDCKRVLKAGGILIMTTHSRNKNIKEKIKWKILNFTRKILNYISPVKGLEEGDKWVRAISGYKITKSKIFMHLYTPKEAIEDLKEGGLKMIDVKCATEIVNRQTCPEIREEDKYIVYIAKKSY